MIRFFSPLYNLNLLQVTCSTRAIVQSAANWITNILVSNIFAQI